MTSVVKARLVQRLAAVFEDLGSEDVSLSLFRGRGELSNLRFSKAYLAARLPSWIRVVSATCASVSVKVPWASLRRRPIRITVRGVVVEAELQAAAASPAAAAEPAPAPASDEAYGVGGKHGLVDSIVDGIAFNLEQVDLHIKGPGFEIRVKLDGLGAVSTNPAFEVKKQLKETRVLSPDRQLITTYKLLTFRHLHAEVTSSHHREVLEPFTFDLTAPALRLRITKPRANTAVLHAINAQLLLHTVRLKLNDHQLQTLLQVARALLDLAEPVKVAQQQTPEDPSASPTHPSKPPITPAAAPDGKKRSPGKKPKRSRVESAQGFTIRRSLAELAPECTSSIHVRVDRVVFRLAQSNTAGTSGDELLLAATLNHIVLHRFLSHAIGARLPAVASDATALEQLYRCVAQSRGSLDSLDELAALRQTTSVLTVDRALVVVRGAVIDADAHCYSEVVVLRAAGVAVPWLQLLAVEYEHGAYLVPAVACSSTLQKPTAVPLPPSTFLSRMDDTVFTADLHALNELVHYLQHVFGDDLLHLGAALDQGKRGSASPGVASPGVAPSLSPLPPMPARIHMDLRSTVVTLPAQSLQLDSTTMQLQIPSLAVSNLVALDALTPYWQAKLQTHPSCLAPEFATAVSLMPPLAQLPRAGHDATGCIAGLRLVCLVGGREHLALVEDCDLTCVCVAALAGPAPASPSPPAPVKDVPTTRILANFASGVRLNLDATCVQYLVALVDNLGMLALASGAESAPAPAAAPGQELKATTVLVMTPLLALSLTDAQGAFFHVDLEDCEVAMAPQALRHESDTCVWMRAAAVAFSTPAAVQKEEEEEEEGPEAQGQPHGHLRVCACLPTLSREEQQALRAAQVRRTAQHHALLRAQIAARGVTSSSTAVGAMGPRRAPAGLARQQSVLREDGGSNGALSLESFGIEDDGSVADGEDLQPVGEEQEDLDDEADFARSDAILEEASHPWQQTNCWQAALPGRADEMHPLDDVAAFLKSGSYATLQNAALRPMVPALPPAVLPGESMTYVPLPPHRRPSVHVDLAGVSLPLGTSLVGRLGALFAASEDHGFEAAQELAIHRSLPSQRETPSAVVALRQVRLVLVDEDFLWRLKYFATPADRKALRADGTTSLDVEALELHVSPERHITVRGPGQSRDADGKAVARVQRDLEQQLALAREELAAAQALLVQAQQAVQASQTTVCQVMQQRLQLNLIPSEDRDGFQVAAAHASASLRKQLLQATDVDLAL